MSCSRCEAINKNGLRCKNNTCRQYPTCWLHLKSQEGLQVKDSNIEGEKGLFASRLLPRGQRVTYYSADTIDKEPTENSDYVLQIGNQRFLNSEKKLNFVGRYINDSRNTGKRPNVRFTKSYQIRRHKKRYVVPMIALRNIKKNEELLTNYGYSYWNR